VPAQLTTKSIKQTQTRDIKGHMLTEPRIGFCLRLPAMSLNFV